MVSCGYDLSDESLGNVSECHKCLLVLNVSYASFRGNSFTLQSLAMLGNCWRTNIHLAPVGS